MALVGKSAPTFKTKAAVQGKISEFSSDELTNKYTILFFYPLDFTFVCPTELHAFEEKKEEFEQRGAQIVGCSVDSVYSHHAWLQTPKAKGGIEGITYPILADLNKEIARSYGVLKEDEGIAYRGLFLIDREGIVRHELINDLPLGRSVDEALRILDALIYYENNGEVCPANWHEGKKAMTPTPDGLAAYFS